MGSTTILGSLSNYQAWPVSVLVLVVTTICLMLAQVAISRQTLPKNAPPLVKGWPILGNIEFYTSRIKFLGGNTLKSANGAFSFYYGSYPIVVLSGAAQRTKHYTTRGFDLSAGFRALFAASPSIDHMYEGNLSAHFLQLFKKLLQREKLEKNLGNLVNDTDVSLEKVDDTKPVDIFDVMFKLVYQLTHRTLGTNDIADDPKMLEDTLNTYTAMDQNSPLQIMFPAWPTISKIRKRLAGAKMFMTLKGIMDDRRKTGRTENDAMQVLMDNGDNDVVISAFIIGALFAGLINSGINAAWILCFMAQHTEWQVKVRAELDAAVAKHRQSDDQTAVDVLKTLSMDAWEQEFPMIDLCLRESIRLNLTSASIRKNLSGKDIPIPNTNNVVPKDGYAVYSMHDIHMDPAIYTEPEKFDPGRYLPDRAEDKKQEHGYVGWGSGLHPCLGMKFAKLEIIISTTMFLASYDYTLCEKNGEPRTRPLPGIDHDAVGTRFPTEKMYLKCEPRA